MEYIRRVVAQYKNLYKLEGEPDFLAEISGKFIHEAKRQADYPAVGDMALVDRTSDREGNGIISKVLPRKSAFIRKAAGDNLEEQIVAANMDTVFICMALNRDYNLRRLERYAAAVWDSGAIPVVVLTKADLCDDAELRITEVEETVPGTDIIVTSLNEPASFEQVLKYASEDRILALIGSSGVGKSTLINQLLGKEILKTNAIRTSDGRGRHTTTGRQLYRIPHGGMIIDTPGMRELGMLDFSDGLDTAFDDIEQITQNCRFNNCRHTTEPGCAVQRALSEGIISPERWQSYQKLRQETYYSEDKERYLEEKKKKYRNIARINRERGR